MLEYLLLSGLFEDDTDTVRARRIERKLDAIIQFLAIDVPRHPRADEVQALADAGETDKAVKLLREISGAGPFEAKQAVEQGRIDAILSWSPAEREKD